MVAVSLSWPDWCRLERLLDSAIGHEWNKMSAARNFVGVTREALMEETMVSTRYAVLAMALLAMISVRSGPVLAEDMGYEIKAMEDLKFVPFGEGSPVQMSLLWGDPATGPVGFLLKIPPGFDAGMHSHTSNYRAVILDGKALHWIDSEDKAAVKPVGEGGYWSQPGGQVHGDANPGDQPALALVIFDGPVDFIPAK